MNRFRLLALVSLFASSLVVSCGDDESGGNGNTLMGVNTFTVGCTVNGSRVCSSSYGINNVEDPIIVLVRGQTYTFNNTEGAAHPFVIKTVGGDTGNDNLFTDGVTGDMNATTTFVVPQNAPNQLFYQCTLHSGMTGTLMIVDSLDDPRLRDL